MIKKLRNIKFYDVGEHAGGFVGYRVYSAGEKKSYYFSVKQLGKRKAKMLATEKALTVQAKHPTFAPLRKSHNGRRIIKHDTPAGIWPMVKYYFKYLKSGELRYYFSPIFETAFYDRKTDILYSERYPINKYGYDGAWIKAGDEFCKRRNIYHERNKLLKMRPEPEVFIKILKAQKRKNKDLIVNWKLFKQHLKAEHVQS